MLYYKVLCCIILLYSIVLHHILDYGVYIILWCIIFYYIVIFYMVLYTAVYYITLYYTTLTCSIVFAYIFNIKLKAYLYIFLLIKIHCWC